MIYVVQYTVGGYYTSSSTKYFRTLEEGRKDFEECKSHIGEDPTVITLSSLDPTDLTVTPIDGWEGCIDDLEFGED